MASNKAANEPPHTVEEYLRHADACERLAQTADTSEHGEIILRIARMWRLLAEDRVKLIKVGTLRG